HLSGDALELLRRRILVITLAALGPLLIFSASGPSQSVFLAPENQFIDPIFADGLPEFREGKNGISTSSGRGLILKGLQGVGPGGEPVNSAEPRIYALTTQPLAYRGAC